jgi:cytochrome c5
MTERWCPSATGCLVLMGLVAAIAYVGADGLQRQPAALPAPAAAQQSPPAEAPAVSPQHALLNRYCISCHNAKLKTGGLALDSVDVDRVGENVDVWEKAVRKLRARSMPPAGPGRPRPDEASYEALISYLETSLDRVAANKPNPGRTDTFHRLNRTEYQNAVRDLLAVDIDATALLPTDDASHGFDNVNIGGLSPTLLDRYLSASQKISRLAVGSPSRSPGEYTFVLPLDLTQDFQLPGLPVGTRGGAAFQYDFPRDGEYALHVELSRARSGIGIMGLAQPQQVEVAIDGERVKLFDIHPPARPAGGAAGGDPPPSEADGGLIVRTAVKAGVHTVLATFIKTRSALSDTEREPDLSDTDANTRKEAGIFSVAVSGPDGPHYSWRDAESPAHFCVPAGNARRRSGVREDDSFDLGAPRLSQAGERCRCARPAHLL